MDIFDDDYEMFSLHKLKKEDNNLNHYLPLYKGKLLLKEIAL